MSITAAQVNELRQKTGAGMMDCKKALIEANGDFEKAIEILRKKGASVAAKRAEKSANEGMIATKVSENGKFAAIVEVNCETDFVAKSEDFVGLTNLVLNSTYDNKLSKVEDILNSNAQVKTKLDEVMGKVGEKIEISRIASESADNGLLVDYVHMGSKLGVIVRFDDVKAGKDELSHIGKDIAMQVAAMRPICVYRDEVPKDIIEKEIEIYKELARKEGKPEQILEKIATGRLNKFYQENCLAEQSFIKDNTKTVSDLVAEFNKKNQSQTKITLFRRFHLGDEQK